MMASLPKREAARTKAPVSSRRVRVVCISDTHELHRELILPVGDLLIHAGHFTFFNSISHKVVMSTDHRHKRSNMGPTGEPHP